VLTAMKLTTLTTVLRGFSGFPKLMDSFKELLAKEIELK